MLVENKPGANGALATGELARWFNQITKDGDTRQFLARAAFEPFPGSPDQMSALLKSDTLRWKGYAELANIQPQ